MMGTDPTRAKNHSTFHPTGPYLVPARFVPDPAALDITLRLNGKTMQKGSTGDMLFGPAALISYISRMVTLQPGDAMDPEITGLGAQRNVCRAATEHT